MVNLQFPMHLLTFSTGAKKHPTNNSSENDVISINCHNDIWKISLISKINSY